MDPYEEIEALLTTAHTLDESAHALRELLVGNYSIAPNGRLYSIKLRVCKIKNLRIEVHPKDHAPPHFHVVADDNDASFNLSDGEMIQGCLDGRDRALIKHWFVYNKQLLIDAWNDSRPGDCKVGRFMS